MREFYYSHFMGFIRMNCEVKGNLGSSYFRKKGLKIWVKVMFLVLFQNKLYEFLSMQSEAVGSLIYKTKNDSELS
jgi:hypothetical protein